MGDQEMTNRVWALTAMTYTLTNLPKGPGNRPLDFVREALREARDDSSIPGWVKSVHGGPVIDSAKKGLDKNTQAVYCTAEVKKYTEPIMEGVIDDSKIRRAAAYALSYGCGNCGEHAVIAFTFLMDHGVKPLDFMELFDNRPRHNFVVIGREVDSEPAKYGTWGENAVVCDPWDRNVYPAREYPVKTPFANCKIISMYRYG